MKVDEVYISPEGFVICKNNYPTDARDISNPSIYPIKKDHSYSISLGNHPTTLIFVIQHDGKSIPYEPRDFISISEWREQQLNQLL